ncbi:hypothetical protein Y032_0701g1652 [Ancylostoma ceylanicum]|uniref:Uncharacterized protein n=1 Tax=Ancylostoma ceylanicum TaxID=53326 RepID=A0A016WHD6_9BILA|nr:hypothetical protein Y032_0701g1652 [Ancylostoma ceylanicum]
MSGAVDRSLYGTSMKLSRDCPSCASSLGEKGRDHVTLIGAFGPPVTLTCFNLKCVDFAAHGVLLRDIVLVQTGGRDGRHQSESPDYAHFPSTMIHEPST